MFPSRVYLQIFNAIKIAKSSSLLFEIFSQCKISVVKKTGYLTSTELRDALHTRIKQAQQIYAHEINDLSKKGQVSSKSQLQPLHTFLDKEGYLRVCGRLQRSHLPYDSKHHLILAPAHHITELIIMNEHLRLLHPCSQLLSASLRQQYWIPRMKQVTLPVLNCFFAMFQVKGSSITAADGSFTFGKPGDIPEYAGLHWHRELCRC
jgi:hypothetical protein